jgi:hypothetical protein
MVLPLSLLSIQGLPVEIQVMILGYTDLIAPGAVTASTLKGYVLDDCCTERCVRGHRCCEGYYDSSSDSCWRLPVDLFHVNRHLSVMSEEIFFSCNEFVVGVCLAAVCEPSRSSHQNYARMLGLCNPEHSKFLLEVPPACISMLRSWIWSFPMGAGHHGLCHIKSLRWILSLRMFGHSPSLPSPLI